MAAAWGLNIIDLWLIRGAGCANHLGGYSGIHRCEPKWSGAAARKGGSVAKRNHGNFLVSFYTVLLYKSIVHLAILLSVSPLYIQYLQYTVRLFPWHHKGSIHQSQDGDEKIAKLKASKLQSTNQWARSRCLLPRLQSKGLNVWSPIFFFCMLLTQTAALSRVMSAWCVKRTQGHFLIYPSVRACVREVRLSYMNAVMYASPHLATSPLHQLPDVTCCFTWSHRRTAYTEGAHSTSPLQYICNNKCSASVSLCRFSLQWNSVNGCWEGFIDAAANDHRWWLSHRMKETPYCGSEKIQ